MKHVALVMSLNKRFDRKVIEGVTRFVRELCQWSVFVEDDPKAKIPDFRHVQFDGVIDDLDDPRIPKQLVGLGIPAVGVGAIREDCPWELDISVEHPDAERGKVTGTAVGCACGDGVLDWDRIVKTVQDKCPRDRGFSVECGTAKQAARSLEHLGIFV